MNTPSFFQAPAVANHLPPPADSQRHHRAPASFSGKGLLILAAGLGIAGFLAGWRWFGAAAVLPLLYTLPCVAMMAMCMRGHGGSAHAPTEPNSGAGPGPETAP